MVRELYQAMGSGDADAVEWFYSLSPHAVFLGTDRAEFWTDSAQHNQEVRPYWEQAGGGRFETRLTFVLHRQDGAWRIVTPTLRSGWSRRAEGRRPTGVVPLGHGHPEAGPGRRWS